jgi:hypothetical protein
MSLDTVRRRVWEILEIALQKHPRLARAGLPPSSRPPARAFLQIRAEHVMFVEVVYAMRDSATGLPADPIVIREPWSPTDDPDTQQALVSGGILLLEGLLDVHPCSGSIHGTTLILRGRVYTPVVLRPISPCPSGRRGRSP